MFLKREFGITVFDKAKLNNLNSVFVAGMTKDEVNNELDKLVMSLGSFITAPSIVLIRTFYTAVDSEVFDSVKISLRLSSKSRLELVTLDSKSFTLYANANIFDNFLDELLTYFRQYEYCTKLNTNLLALNTVVAELSETEGVAVNVAFGSGNGVVDIDGNKIIVGLTDDVIQGLGTLPIFADCLDILKDNYRQSIIDVLKSCVKPYDIFKIKSVFTKDLGVQSRKSIVKLIRKVVTRKISNIRAEGVGYYEDEKTFAVIEKVLVADKDVEKYADWTIVDNVNPAKAEREKGLTKIAVKVKVAAFDKDNLGAVDIALLDMLKEIEEVATEVTTA